MLRGYKTEILPNAKQTWKIRQTLGICRYLYNLYLASNFEVCETLGSGFFVTAFTFDKYVNHVVKKELPWIFPKNGKGDWTIWRHSEPQQDSASKKVRQETQA